MSYKASILCASWKVIPRLKTQLILFLFAGDLSSASEVSDNESDDSDSRDLSGYACRHCFTTSK